MKKLLLNVSILILLLISLSGCQKEGIENGAIPDDIYAFLGPFLDMNRAEALEELAAMDMEVKFQNDDQIQSFNIKSEVYITISFDGFQPTKIRRVSWGMNYLFPTEESPFKNRKEAYDAAVKFVNAFKKYESTDFFNSAIYHPYATIYQNVETFINDLNTYQSTFNSCYINNGDRSFLVTYNENNDNINSHFHIEMSKQHELEP